MSLFLGVLSAAVALDDSKYKKTLKGLEESSDNSFSKIANAAARYLTAAGILNFGRKAIQTFSDLEESTNKFDVVFQGFTKEAGDAVDELTKKFGQSELSAKQMLSGTGDILTGFGFDRKLALDMSTMAAQLGADLASFTNYAGGAAGATDALTKAMLGETESAKMLGIVIKQDSEEYKNLVEQAMTTGVQIKEGGEKIVVSNEQQAKAVAALALAYQQSKNAHGDFLRSQDSIANQTQILKNNLTKLYTVIGKEGAGAYADALKGANALLKWYTGLSSSTRTVMNNTALLTASLILLGRKGYLASANAAFRALTANLAFAGGAKVAAAGTGIMTVAIHGLKTAFHALHVAMGPVGWAILAIGAAYTAFSAIISNANAEIEKEVENAKERYDNAKKETEQLKERNRTHQDYFSRLEELAKYESLNNDEKQEANKIAKELQSTYGNLGIEIDKMSGKLRINEDAWKKMTEAQTKSEKAAAQKEYEALRNREKLVKKQAERALLSYIMGEGDMINGSNVSWHQAALIAKHGNLQKLKELHDLLESSGDDDDATIAVKKLLEIREEQIRVQKRINELEKQGTDAAERAKKARAEAGRQQISNTKKALDELNAEEWQIKFDTSSLEQQAEMLRAKINKVFEEYKRKGQYASLDSFMTADKSKMSETELKDRKTILQLLNDESKITKKIADDRIKAAEAEKKAREISEKKAKEERERKEAEYKKELDRIEKRRKKAEEELKQQEQKRYQRRNEVNLRYNAMKSSEREEDYRDKIIRRVEALQKKGGTDAANKLLQREIDRIQARYSKTEERYLQFMKKRDKKGLRGGEQASANSLLDALKKLRSDEKFWRSRISEESADKNPELAQKQIREAVGAWSLSSLKRMASESPEAQTARNTKETARGINDLKRMAQNGGLTFQ